MPHIDLSLKILIIGKAGKCYSGVEQIVVDFDGTVMIGWCRVGGSLGNMKDPDNIAWPIDPVICNKSYCHCNFDIMSKKERV